MRRFFILSVFTLLVQLTQGQRNVVVFQSDFDLTHEIPPYNIWEAAYRLRQTVPYWPAGTVFVSVVDPGVGTERKSVVLKTRTGQYIVTPDNGTLTLVAETHWGNRWRT
jgi:S-adenosylmethionine hydrolase